MQEYVSLAPLTTLKIGGPARYFVRATGEEELRDAARFTRERKLALFVLGGGSNLVVADAGFAGLVMQIGFCGESVVSATGQGSVLYQVAAGTGWDEFVRLSCKAGLSGVECLAGIPGTVGGSPVQNIGAYGQEVAQTIHCVRAFDLQTLEFVDLAAKECGFGYRRSLFNSTAHGRYIVTRVDFEFNREATPKLNYAELQRRFSDGPTPTPSEVAEVVCAIRASKGMLIDPEHAGPDSRSAGSFFKNPAVKPKTWKNILETIFLEPHEVPHWPQPTGEIKLAAAWLIEQSGFKKGFALGRAGISSKHTLALINRTGDATCADLLRLRDLIVLTVEQRFGVTLEQEPVLLGTF